MQHVAVALIVLAAAGARGAEPGDPGPVRVSADRIAYDQRSGRLEASGAARVDRAGSSIRADSIVFEDASGLGVAEGDVVIEDGLDVLKARRVDLDVYSTRGVAFDAELVSEAAGVRLKGARIEKTGDATYRFEDSSVTTCDCPDTERQPWTIEASEADLEVEGYMTARNARFEVLGVPVAWFPWIFYPVKTRRQSGLLLPEVAVSGRNGFEIGLPLFLAVGDPVNVTLTPRWLQKRGPKLDLESEWVLGDESAGYLFGSFIKDRDVHSNTISEPYGDERWTVLGREDLFLPGDVRGKADFAFVSDNQYATDFDEPLGARTLRYLESTAFLGRDFGRSGVFGLVGSADFADDLQNPDDEDRDPFLLQRLPQVDAALLPMPLPILSRLVSTLGLRYTYFGQRDSAQAKRPTASVVGDDLFLDTGIDSLPDAQELGPFGGGVQPDPNRDNFGLPAGTENDGRFQEGEPLADTGQRVLLTPRLALPLRLLDWLELYPEVGWYQTLYDSDAQHFEQRGLFTGRADLRTRLRRRFGDGSVHVLEPRIGWAIVSRAGQSRNPLYVPPTAVPQRRLRQLDLENRVLDPADRIPHQNVLTLALGNRVYRGVSEDGASRLVGEVELSAAYEAADGEFGNLYLDARAYPWKGADTWLILGFDPEQARLDEALLDLAWQSRSGHRLGFGYRYRRRVGRFYEDFRFYQRFSDFKGEFNRINQVVGSARLLITDRLALSYQGGFSFEDSILLANQGGIEYFSRCKCWSAGISVAQNRVSGVSVSFSYSLTGLGRDDVARAAERRRRSGLGFLDGF